MTGSVTDLDPSSVEATGRFRVYLGAAPGVGKTYAMLNEGRRRKQRGSDVAIGFVECHGRQSTEELIDHLEVIRRRNVLAGKAGRRPPDHQLVALLSGRDADPGHRHRLLR